MMTSLPQVHQAILEQLFHQPPVEGISNLHKVRTALLFSGGLESTHVRRYLKEHTSDLSWEPFRISMLLDTREYGIILPAVIQARYEGYKQVIISDDHTADAPYYTKEGAELLLTSGGRAAASKVLGINVIANEDWGLVFDKWDIMPFELTESSRPIVSCFEQEYNYWEKKNVVSKMCGGCKKCFAVYVLQVAKHGFSNVVLDQTTWYKYVTEAYVGMKFKNFNYGVEIFHLINKHQGWNSLRDLLPNRLKYDLTELEDRYLKYEEKKCAPK